jgi:flavin reductase (DIM6/NTAB) family NADH-FMN oxidoreductase RutF
VPIIGDLYKQIGRSTAGAVCIAAAYHAVTDAVVGLTASSFVTLSFDPSMVAKIECLTSQIIMSGDHAIVVGIVEAATTEPGDPLLYFSGKYGTFATI